MISKLYKKYDIQAEVRDYQERICEKSFNFLDTGSSVMIESPTGSGKTTMLMSTCKLLEDKYPGIRVGWATMRRNNLAQAERENAEKRFNLDLRLISMFEKNPPQVDILVVDEGHHDATESMNNVHAKCKPKHTIGATATPVRSDRAALYFKRTVRDANTRYLVKQGHLAQFNHYSINDWNPEGVAETYCRDKKRWGKSVIFFRTMEECIECANFLRANKIRVEIVTGDSDRDQQIEDFEAGRLDVLINMMVLTEGFDMPALQSVFVRPSSKGPSLQMAGRVMRKFNGLIKNVVQSSNTHYEFTKEADAHGKFKWSNGLWLPVEDKEHLLDEQVLKSLSTLSKIAQGQVIDK